MHIVHMAATGGEIVFHLNTEVRETKLRISLFPAAIGEEGEICSLTTTVTGTSFQIPRRLSGADGITCRYVVTDAAGEVEGKKYVESVADTPVPPSGGAVNAIVWDTEDVPRVLADGIRHAAVYVSLPDLLFLYPEGENTLYFRDAGRDFYIRQSVAAYLDDCIRPLTEAGVAVTLVLLNAREWIGRASDRFFETVAHPSDTAAQYARFDTVRASGCAYYRAFVTFLAERYRPQGIVIGAEANALSDEPLQRCAEAYITALRVAQQCTAHLGVRVYAAIDEHFAEKVEHGHTGRDFLSALAGFSLIEGDFLWGVAVTACADVQAVQDFLATSELLVEGDSREILILPDSGE